MPFNMVQKMMRGLSIAAVVVASGFGSQAALAADAKSSRYAYLSCFPNDRWKHEHHFASYDDCFTHFKQQYQNDCSGFEDAGEKYCY